MWNKGFVKNDYSMYHTIVLAPEGICKPYLGHPQNSPRYPYTCSYYCALQNSCWPSTGMGGSSQVVVSNLIDLGYWRADKVTKHYKATSCHTTEMDNSSAKHCSLYQLQLLEGKIMVVDCM